MDAEAALRVSVIGSPADIELVRASAQFGAEIFIVEGGESGGISAMSDIAPDVAVIGPDVDKPLPIAREIRLAFPQSQILFLLRPERLERFRAALPFVPNLASAWTASVEAGASYLGSVIGEAAKAARQQSAKATVLDRINRKLATHNAQPAEARHAQLALSERYLATILSQSPDAFIAVDLGGSVIASNEAAATLLGERIGSSGIHPSDLLAEEQGRKVSDAIRRAAAGESLLNVEVELGQGGGREPSFAEFSFGPVEDDNGSIASVSITARDITGRKQAEQRQQLLVAELNHRVKNTLAIVRALAAQSFKNDRPLAEERNAFESRLSALAAAHDLLTESAWKHASLAGLLQSSLSACGADLKHISTHGPKIILSPEISVSLAMALHELCTNAIKYGALSTTEGQISIDWDITGKAEEERLKLEWIESGGPQVKAPIRRGFGLRMLEQGLGRELQGSVSVEFREEGVVCRIDAPLPRH